MVPLFRLARKGGAPVYFDSLVTLLEGTYPVTPVSSAISYQPLSEIRTMGYSVLASAIPLTKAPSRGVCLTSVS